MIPFLVKTRFDRLWLWQESEACRLKGIFTFMPNQNKWWNRTYSTVCLVFGDMPLPEQLHRNIRWKLFNSEIPMGLL